MSDNSARLSIPIFVSGLSSSTSSCISKPVVPVTNVRMSSVKPGPDGLYTCPTVIFPDGTYVMDSKVIAPEIEKRYPSPTLKLESPMDARVRDAVIRFMTELRPVYVTQVPKKFLSEASVPFFRTSRAKDLGMSLEQLEADNPKEAVFEKASPALKDLAHILKENSGGPFLEGEQVVYMDFILTGAILFFQDMGSDIFDDFLQSSGDPETYKKYLDAMSPWTKRNDY